MRRASAGAALACLAVVLSASDTDQRQAPAYSSGTVVNLASGEVGNLAPNTLAAIYGQELSYVTRARERSEQPGGLLPYVLTGTGVTVKVNGLLAGVEYVSPEVVVFVVPADLLPGPAQVILTRNALNGPVVRVTLSEVAPALLPYEECWVLARRAGEDAWVSEKEPARAGAEVVVYATGLGLTEPPQENRSIASARHGLQDPGRLTVRLNGRPLDRREIVYSGVTPGTAGIYEIRFRAPGWAGDDPEIRVSLGEKASRSGMFLRLRAQPGVDLPRSIQ